MRAVGLITGTSRGTASLIESRWTRLAWTTVKRVLGTGISVFVIITILFFILKSLPGDETILQQKNLTESERAALVARYGFDLPIFGQYRFYLDTLFTGSFGLSTTIRTETLIETFVWERIGWSMAVGTCGVVIGTFLAWLFSIAIAFSPNGVVDRVFQVLVAIFAVMPTFILGAIFVIIASTNRDFPILFSKTNIAAWILPMFTVAIPIAFINLWRIRAGILEVHRNQSVIFATVKGMPRALVVIKHIIPQSLLPLAVSFPLNIAYSMVNLLLIEGLFSIPGAGLMLQDAVLVKDYNVILAICVVQVVFIGVAFLMQDFLAKVLDPRNRRKG